MARPRTTCVMLAILAAGTVALLAQPALAATTVSTGSCVDGGGTRWSVRAVWGNTYASGSTTRVALSSAGWTTGRRGLLATDSRVRTYDGAGTRLQDMRWSGSFDYAAGTVRKSRNPVNPPSAPGRSRVAITLGVDGDGFGSCTVTLVQPNAPDPTAPTPTPTPTPTPAPTLTPSDRYESDVVTATNQARTAEKLRALAPQACVDSYAEAQAARMASSGRMYHQDLGPVLNGCNLRRVGENVAYGYADGAAATAGWMGSEGHRANILTPQYTLLGVGAAQDGQGRWYACQVFGAAD